MVMKYIITIEPETLREFIDNDTTTGYKISIHWLGMTKVKSGGASMMLKTRMGVAQYYTVFNYGPPRPQKELKYQHRTILAGPGVNQVPDCFSQGISKKFLGSPSPHRCLDHG